MKILSRLVLGAALLSAGVAFAEGEATDPTVQARQALMKTVGMNSKILGDMAGGKTAFDAAGAAAAKAALAAAAADIAAKFETQATDPATEAKPEIWTNWEDFVTKATALKTAAEGLDASSLDSVKAGMGVIGGTCKACHTAYRM